MESGAFARHTIDANCPAMTLDNAMDDTEPQTRTLINFLGGEIGIKDPLYDIILDAVTGV